MNKRIIYHKAYRTLENSTPLKFDCGLLCNSKCCTGDSEQGMCLFPGEEQVLDWQGEFLSIRKEKLLDSDVLFAVCEGTCSRCFRPLSCRIFPLVPYMDAAGKLNVMEDPRARYLCPLLMKEFEFRIDRIFKRKVLRTFQFLIRDADIRNHIRLLSSVLDEYARLLG